jgi:hypothetical protein
LLLFQQSLSQDEELDYLIDASLKKCKWYAQEEEVVDTTTSFNIERLNVWTANI